MELESRAPGLRIFVLLSLVLHIAAGVALHSLGPAAQRGLETPYFVSLLPPLEAEREALPEVKAPRELRPRPLPRKAPPTEPDEAPRVLRGKGTAAGPPAAAQPGGPKGRAGGGPGDGAAGGARYDAMKPGVQDGGPPGPEAPDVDKKGLFDKEVLDKVIAGSDTAKADKGTITFDTNEIRYYGYMEKLKERIETTWVYPREAIARGIYGDLVIRFVIKKDGTLGSVELLRTSGRPVLDKAALAALRGSEPFWPLPEDWKQNSLSVTGHFIYTLYGGYFVR